MNIITADAETFFSDDYTLSKMTTEEYIRDPRFECHGWAIRSEDSTFWLTHADFVQWSKRIDWSNTALLAHHAQFDGLILSHHYGIKPRFWFDTLSMARLLLGNHLSVGLDALAKHFGMNAKTVPYNLFKGKHWSELSPVVKKQVGDGARWDVDLTWQLFQTLGRNFPREEFEVIDTLIKMFTDPVLRADINMLGSVWTDEATKKQDRLAALNVTAADLQSADRFAQLLRDEGIEPAMKPGKNKDIYAFAKTDAFMRELQEDENERVRTLAEARLGAKSTLLQTRAETLGFMARRGSLPVYLRYAGAGTLRPSGGDGANWLNFKRGSLIRKAILAPEGYLLGPVDASQIECRVLHFLAGGRDEPVIQKFRANEDPYVDLATRFYGETIYKPEKSDPRRAEMEAKRGMGKQGRLMCLGPETLVLTDQGFKTITAVRPNDWLWDGIEWVKHKGLIYQGEQAVVDLLGVKMTSGHRVLCGPFGWLSAAECLHEENIRFHALERGSANLPSQAMNLALKAESHSSLCGVVAVLRNIRSWLKTCAQEGRLDVALAPQKLPVFGQKNIKAMQTLSPMMRTVADSLEESEQFTHAAIHQRPKIGTLTGDEVFASTRSGNGASRGVAIFFHILLRYLGGIIRLSNWIEKTTNAATCPAIYNSSLRDKILRTGAELLSCPQLSSTYDLAFAGPRNRFTILSDRGPLIVHNCGYGAAGPKFKATAKAGLYGPPVEISIEDANAFVKMYRETNPSVCGKLTGYWAICDNIILPALANGTEYEIGPLRIANKRIYLPNGAPMIYDTLEWHVPDADEEHRDFERDGFWRMRTRSGWKKMWGAKLTQNICEAVSRVIVSQAMIRIKQRGYRTLNWPYDELLVLIPDDGKAEEHLENCRQEMIVEPTWLPGIPLDAEATLGERYSK